MSKTTFNGLVKQAPGGPHCVVYVDGTPRDIASALAEHVGKSVDVTVTVKPERKARGWRWVKESNEWSALYGPNGSSADGSQRASAIRLGDGSWDALVFVSDESGDELCRITCPTKRTAKLLCRAVIEAVDGVKLEAKP